MDPLLSLLPAAGVFTPLAVVIIYLIRQDAVTRKQAGEHFARISKENVELRAEVDTERDRRMATEEKLSALRRRYGVTEGTHD